MSFRSLFFFPFGSVKLVEIYPVRDVQFCSESPVDQSILRRKRLRPIESEATKLLFLLREAYRTMYGFSISRLCRSYLFPVAVAGLRPGEGDRIPCLVSSRANPKGEFGECPPYFL